jgi:hypothetical protein
VVIEPEIGEFGYDDFVRAPELVRAGEVATRAVLPKIREWLPTAQPEQPQLTPPDGQPETSGAVALSTE